MSNREQKIKIQIVEKLPGGSEEVTLFQAIGLLSELAGKDDPESFESKLHIHDPIIRVHSLIELINSPSFSTKKIPLILHIAKRSAYIRTLLVPLLAAKLRFDLVDVLIKAQQESSENSTRLRELLMEAEVNNDYSAQAKLHTELYFETGDKYHLKSITTIAKERMPWQSGWVHLLRMVFIAGPDEIERALLLLFTSLEQADVQHEFKLIAKYAMQLENCSYPLGYAMAQIKYWDNDFQGCLEYLDKSNLFDFSKRRTSLISTLAAKCYEALKDYSKAAECYAHQNKVLDAQTEYTVNDYIEGIKARAAIPVPNLELEPEKARQYEKYFIMCGFPRSGTTLLENALSAHPAIATCEETSSLLGAARIAYMSPLQKDPDFEDYKFRTDLFLELYHKSLDRYVEKESPAAIIDKTPIISSNIEFMEKVFPTRRYLFSIRHPYDVVISNYKQAYAQNAAMSAFNHMYETCVLYDHVMSTWFKVFPGETNRVHYIRYDELVTDFESVLKGALEFLKVDWTDEVLNFVEHSKARAVRTPSYSNVRKGLTIGVQSSWKKYEFLFDRRCRELLDPWVERFGYSME